MTRQVSDIGQQANSFKADFSRVHQEISKVIVGYSDLILAECVDPPLTTITQPFQEMGRVAVQHLMALLEEESEASPDETGEYLLPTQLIVRASTGAV